MAQVKKLTPRQQDQQRRVLDSTRQMLAEEGYDGLQMRALAERADVSLMTIYNRFGNKDDLILLALREMLSDLGERVDGSGKRGIELTLHNAEVVGKQILETPEYARAMALMVFNGQPGSPIVQTLLGDALTSAREQITEMRKLRELNDSVDVTLLARGLSVCGWSSILLWMKNLVPDDEFLAQYRRAPLLVLASAMTRPTRQRYAAELKGIG